MQVNPDSLPPHQFYRYLVQVITPRPIAWVSTISPSGVPNLAPFSFFNGVGSNPPSVVFSPVNNRAGEKKHTLKNIEANGQFVVNMVSHSLAPQMNQTAYEYDYEVNEFERANLSAVASTQVAPPRVADASITMECELMQIVPVGEGPLAANLVIGKILLLHLADGICDEQGVLDPEKIDLVGRMGGANYCTTRDRFELSRPQSP